MRILIIKIRFVQAENISVSVGIDCNENSAGIPAGAKDNYLLSHVGFLSHCALLSFFPPMALLQFLHWHCFLSVLDIMFSFCF